MNEQINAIVEAFRRLSDEDQAEAYLEIDAIWKSPWENQWSPLDSTADAEEAKP